MFAVVEFARLLAVAHESFANQLRQASQQLVDDRFAYTRHLTKFSHASDLHKRKYYFVFLNCFLRINSKIVSHRRTDLFSTDSDIDRATKNFRTVLLTFC